MCSTTMSLRRSQYFGIWPALYGVKSTSSNNQSGWSGGSGSGVGHIECRIVDRVSLDDLDQGVRVDNLVASGVDQHGGFRQYPEFRLADE